MVTEIDDSLWGCERIDAEILTNDGWKTYDKLKDDDLVMTYLDSGEIKWVRFTAKFSYDMDGYLDRFYDRTISICVTDKHHFKVLRRITKGNAVKHTAKVIGYSSHYVSVDELKTNDKLPITGAWNGINKEDFVLPEIERVKGDGNDYKDVRIPMEDWVAFLGIYLAEGSIRHNPKGGNYRIHIWQTKPHTKKIIGNLLSKLPFNFVEKDDEFLAYDKQLWTYLKRFGKTYDKYIPREILDLDKKYLQILYDWLILGDGNISKSIVNGKRYTDIIKYYTTSPMLRNNFEELLLKLGYSFNTVWRKRNGNIDGKIIYTRKKCYEITVRKSKYVMIGRLKKEKEVYKGKVFDLEVPEGRCFYVRRSGRGYFTGNSPVGGIFLGFHHIESNRIIIKEVPVTYFQGNKFLSKEYLDESVKCARIALFKDLRVPATEELHICSGYVLSKIFEWATEIGFVCLKTKITGKLQKVLEEASRNYVASLPNFIKKDSEPLYDALIKWLQKNPDDRLKYAKTGWKAIKKKFEL